MSIPLIDPQELLQLMSMRRSIRKFHEDQEIPREVLERIVHSAIYAPFSCNLQPVDVAVVHSREGKEKIFPYLTWARHVEGMAPQKGERPTAYIVPLMNRQNVERLCAKFRAQGGRELEMRTRRSVDVSYGIQEGFMLLQAQAEGVGTCVMAGIDENAILHTLGMSAAYEIPALIAMGYTNEKQKPVRKDVPDRNASTKYYITPEGKLEVPKIPVEVTWI